MTLQQHDYQARVVWDGNLGAGTARYDAYGRAYRVLVAGKVELAASADPAFRGDPTRHNPEELFLASVASCHMLFYLALCARSGVQVLAYEDQAAATLRVDGDGGGRFEAITLRPVVTIGSARNPEAPLALHDEAHRRCFLANSCSVPIRVEPVIHHAAEEAR